MTVWAPHNHDTWGRSSPRSEPENAAPTSTNTNVSPAVSVVQTLSDLFNLIPSYLDLMGSGVLSQGKKDADAGLEVLP